MTDPQPENKTIVDAETFDWLSGVTCNPQAPEECEACQ